MFKRIALFMLTNFLVIITIGLIVRSFGLDRYITAHGLDYAQLMVFCLIWGMGGAFVSLLLSKVMAKTLMRVRVISEGSPRTSEEAWLVQTVHRFSKQAGIQKMPEVGIYPGAELNAFATGPTRNNALVAVSAGLLQGMNQREIEGVLAHEVSHIANGDMVTMTLIQGIVNAFVLFLARVLAYAITSAMNRGENNRGGLSYGSYYLVSFLLEIVLMFFGMMIVAWFSRHREFRADHGGAYLAGKENMRQALQKLQAVYGLPRQQRDEQPAIASLKISGKTSKLMRLFATHPPLTERIARLN